jgi:hypothetical protein
VEKVGFAEVGQEDFEGTICRTFMHPDTGWPKRDTGTGHGADRKMGRA